MTEQFEKDSQEFYLTSLTNAELEEMNTPEALDELARREAGDPLDASYYDDEPEPFYPEDDPVDPPANWEP